LRKFIFNPIFLKIAQISSRNVSGHPDGWKIEYKKEIIKVVIGILKQQNVLLLNSSISREFLNWHITVISLIIFKEI
jgi:hypothetical protein